ncbi:MAG TPA: proton-conducting transporter membrane subunit [Candidatus Dormibacteraeota bacterium]|nr:proton-conducting transporter membrane subunit [Candidatus Dormibacteraeota bacterium]
MPLVVLTPLFAFVLAATSVRTRRSAANMAMFGAVVMLALSLLVAWGMTRRTTPFQVTYPYLNVPVAFTGPPNFQGFGIDIILRVDRLTSVAMIVMELCVIGALAWHRVMGRSEPGAARFYALVSAFLFAAAGALVSYDLAELFAFWGLAGAVTYLILAHRWSSIEASRSGQVALVLPFFSDLALLCGIAVIYSHYGLQNIGTLVPILHTTPGVGTKSLVAISVLLFVGVAGRLALWPLHAWLTSNARSSPPAGSAMAQSVWSVVGILILYRLMPIISASNAATLRDLVYACAVAAIAAPALTLFGNDPRRALILAGSGVAAIGAGLVIHAYAISSTTLAVVGVACVLAVAPARAAAMLAASAITAAMRTDDMAEMGDGWRRMRASTVALLLSALVIGLSACGALAFGVSSSSRFGLAMGEAILLVSIAAIRVFFAVAIGPLRRRRAFEPDRVREAATASLSWPYWLATAGAVLAVASLFPAWIGYLDGHKHNAAPVGGILVWVGAAALGIALTAAAFVYDKDGALRASAALGRWLDQVLGIAAGLLSRFVYEPVLAITLRINDLIPEGDGELARAAAASGRLALAAARLPAVPIVIGLAALLALVVGIVSPGVFR